MQLLKISFGSWYSLIYYLDANCVPNTLLRRPMMNSLETKMQRDERVTIEQVAASALAREGLRTRHLAQTFLRHTPHLAEVPEPTVQAPNVRAAAAAFVELFAERRAEQPPHWAAHVQREGAPIFLLTCKPGSFTYQLCLTESPRPLRERNLYAPENYLTFAWSVVNDGGTRPPECSSPG